MLDEFNFKKKFGQNFLVDHNILEKIIKTSNIEAKSLVIEIGVGSANLTKYLCENATNVIGYEIDTTLNPYIEKTLKDYDNYKIIYEDFLKRDLNQDIKGYQYDNLYVVANVPYYITTPIIEHIINSNLKTKNIVLMVQKEVGDRFSSKPGSKEYGSITVYLNYYYDVVKEFVVSRHCFLPKPNVDSIIISLKSKKRISLNDENHFLKLVRDSFQYKRKTIRNNLKNYDLKKIEEILKEYGYTLDVRSEQLAVEIFCAISNHLSI